METLEPRHPLPVVSCLEIPAEVARELPEKVRAELALLPADQQKAFVDDYRKKSKSLAMAYLVSLIYCHYLLLGRWTMTAFMFVSLFVAAALGSIWWMIDLIRMPALVREHNERVAMEALQRLRGLAGEATPLVQP